MKYSKQVIFHKRQNIMIISTIINNKYIKFESSNGLKLKRSSDDAIVSEAIQLITSPITYTEYDDGNVVTFRVGNEKEYVINQMSAACNSAIVSGFDATLSDGETYHFDLTVEDQINLMGLQAEVAIGTEQIPYHASGEPCRFFSRADITAICTAGSAHKTYHVSYFNSLKAYINSLDDVSNVTYGMEIPLEYQSSVLQAIYAGI